MKCQHKDKKTATEETSGGRWEDYSYYEPCAKPVTKYRQCGRGCKHEIGYCPEHGAIERATEEMGVHHKTHEIGSAEYGAALGYAIERAKGVEAGFAVARSAAAALLPTMFVTDERPLRDTAFVVGFIDTTDGVFKGVGVFSEETPTTKVTMFPFTILRGRGRDYQEGLDNLRARLADPVVPWAWLVRLLDERSREQIGLVAA